ncbi:MAG: hypothetical protein OXR66_01170 [Candidatus Woesearchaeota archaeon]|nr:hypothetical protein [Candidatus Woesearchaeota archaeon]
MVKLGKKRKESKEIFSKKFFLLWSILFFFPYSLSYAGHLGSVVGFEPLTLPYSILIEAMFFFPWFFLIIYFFPTNLIMSFVAAVLLANMYIECELFRKCVMKTYRILCNRKTSIILSCIFLCFFLGMSYNHLLFEHNKNLEKDKFCKFMIPSDSKSFCYFQLAKNSEKKEDCEKATSHKGCKKIVAETRTLDVSICGDPSAGHSGSCVRDVILSVESVMQRRINSDNFCTPEDDICLVDNFKLKYTVGNMKLFLKVNSNVEREVSVSSTLCRSYDGIFKPVECRIMNYSEHILKSGTNDIVLEYSADEYLKQRLAYGKPIGIKFIKIDLPNGSFVGAYDLEYVGEWYQIKNEYIRDAEERITDTKMHDLFMGNVSSETCSAIQSVVEESYNKNTKSLTDVPTWLCWLKSTDCSGANDWGYECGFARDGRSLSFCEDNPRCSWSNILLEGGVKRNYTGFRENAFWSIVNGNIKTCYNNQGMLDYCLRNTGLLWLDCEACSLMLNTTGEMICKKTIEMLSDGKIMCDIT